MNITRKWSMPNKNTFSIPPINELVQGIFLQKMLNRPLVACDPFVNHSPFEAQCVLTNDLDPLIPSMSHKDAIDFLKGIESSICDIVLFDPPYSPRQVSECYKKLGKTVNMTTTQSSYWGDLKKEISRICKPGAVVVSCGWNSGGCGRSNGFEITDILIVPHGGWHNDTIVTVEIKKWN